MFPHQVPAVKPQPEAVFPQLWLSPSVASPSWLHTVWRQMQGWLLFLPPPVQPSSVSRLCRLPDTTQKSAVGRRGREEAKRKKLNMKMKKINCTTTDDLQFALSVLIPFWHDWPAKCCTLIEINVSTIVLIACPVFEYYDMLMCESYFQVIKKTPNVFI